MICERSFACWNLPYRFPQPDSDNPKNASTYNQILSKYPHDSLTPKTPGFDSESSNFTGIRSNCGDAPECHRCALILNVVQTLPCQLCQCVSHRLSMAQCHYVVPLPTLLAIIICFANLPASLFLATWRRTYHIILMPVGSQTHGPGDSNILSDQPTQCPKEGRGLCR